MVTKVVNKSLAGAEDVLRGVDKVTQIRNGQAYEVNQLHTPVAVSSTANMADLNPAQHQYVAVVTATETTNYKYSATDTTGITSPYGGSWLVEKAYVDDMLVKVQQPITGLARSQHEKNAELKSVLDYAGSSVNAKCAAMIADVGYVRFTNGEHVLVTGTLDAPLFFDAGAYLTVAAGNTLTITDRINSPNQWIFKGDGDYALSNNGDTGEDTRQLHASWFGVFPSLDMSVDMAPRLQKAVNSVGNLRESVIDFDVGNYRMGSTVTLTRGCWIRGSGSRRTVFSQLTDGFVVFVTGATAARFSGIQFENVGMGGAVRTSPYIQLKHTACEVYDVMCGRAYRSIEIQSNGCRVDNVIYVFDATAGYPGVGSTVISIRGANNRVSNIFGFSSADMGPESIIHLGADAGTLGCSGNLIENITGVTPSIAVLVDARNITITRTIIDNVIQGSITGPVPEAAVKVISGGTSSVNQLTINKVSCSNYPTNGIVLIQNSTGTMEDILIDNVTVDSVVGAGISFTQTAGTLRDVILGSLIDVSEAAQPYAYSGRVLAKVNATAVSNALPATCYDYTIANDSVAVLPLNRSVFTGMLMITIGTSNYLVSTFRAAATPAAVPLNVSSNVDTVLTALTGTTGVSGKFTLGVTDGTLYFENRLGASQRISVSIMTGVM